MIKLIENLIDHPADIQSSHPLGFLSLAHGDTIFLNKEENLKSLSVLKIPQGVIRGNHFHQKREENLYILSGKLIGYYWNPEKPSEGKDIILKKNSLITIPSGVAHGIEALEPTIAIEFSAQEFDLEDYFKLENPFLNQKV